MVISPVSGHHSSQSSSPRGKAGVLLVLLLSPNCRAAPFEALHATWNRNMEQWHPLEMDTDQMRSLTGRGTDPFAAGKQAGL